MEVQGSLQISTTLMKQRTKPTEWAGPADSQGKPTPQYHVSQMSWQHITTKPCCKISNPASTCGSETGWWVQAVISEQNSKCKTQEQKLHLDPKFATRYIAVSWSGLLKQCYGGYIYTYSYSYISQEKENQSHSKPDAGHKFIKMNEAPSFSFDAWRLKIQAILLLFGIKVLYFSPPKFSIIIHVSLLSWSNQSLRSYSFVYISLTSS